MASSETPLIDTSQLEPIVGEDLAAASEILTELIELFVDENQSKLIELTQCLGKEQSGSLRQQAHALAGSAGNLGLARLSELCRDTEIAIVQSSLTHPRQLAQDIADTYHQSVAAFRARFC